MAKKIERRNSSIHGSGVFATAKIKKGAPIVEYKGKLFSHEEADAEHHSDIDTGHTFLFSLNEKWIINANEKGNIARWINHSCAPNAIAFVHDHKSGKLKKEKVIIEALRAIEPGEEITYDYGFEFEVPYTKKLLSTWACQCGAPNCIGTMLKPKGVKEKEVKEGKEGKEVKEGSLRSAGADKKARGVKKGKVAKAVKKGTVRKRVTKGTVAKAVKKARD